MTQIIKRRALYQLNLLIERIALKSNVRMMLTTKETFLFDKIIFGPVQSRRFGVSLGINLLPVHSKLCNFDCVYCECGRNNGRVNRSAPNAFNSRLDVKKSLEAALIDLKLKNISPDAITFAGNGEPTMHPEFAEIVDDTIELRNKHFPNAKVIVLTNATMLNRKEVVDALKKADGRILKLDAGSEELFKAINQPHSKRSLNWIVDHLHYFKGDLTIQSMFLKGLCKGVMIDNSSDENVAAWLELLKIIKPNFVMIYSIDRATAEKGLEKIPTERLNEIAAKVNELGINTMVS